MHGTREIESGLTCFDLFLTLRGKEAGLYQARFIEDKQKLYEKKADRRSIWRQKMVLFSSGDKITNGMNVKT